jgi:hypothetical protein
VRHDADVDYTVAELVDGAFPVSCHGRLDKRVMVVAGAFFNSGQSCCAVEVRPCFTPCLAA